MKQDNCITNYEPTLFASFVELSPSNSIKALMYNSHILSGDKTTKVNYGPQHLAPTKRAIAMLSGALRACLHGGGGPQVGEVTRFGG